jgi:hypothetical protein
MFYKLNPQYCGVFGRKTLYAGELTDVPSVIYRMHGDFNVYPDDELVEVSGQYLGTPTLGETLKALQPRATGLYVDEVTVTTTLDFRRNYPGKELPPLKWFKITGKAGIDDFGLSRDHELIISERALREFRPKIMNCKITAYNVERV